MIGDVGDRAAHVEPFALQPRGLRGDRLRVEVDQRDPRPVRREHLAVRESESAGAAGDDHTEPGHVEPRGNVHAALPPVISGAAEQPIRPPGSPTPSAACGGASRMRSTRAGHAGDDGVGGDVLGDDGAGADHALSPTRDAAQDARAVADPAVVADAHVALVDPLLADRALDLDHAVVEVDEHHAVGDDALAPDRDVLEGRDRALLAEHGLGADVAPRPRGRGSWCRGRSTTSGRAAGRRRGRSRR